MTTPSTPDPLLENATDASSAASPAHAALAKSKPPTEHSAFKKCYMVASVAIVALSYHFTQKIDAETSTGFLLAAFSLMLNGFAVLYPGKFAQKALLVISLVLCSAGAYTFVQSLKNASASGPRLYDVTFSFNAVQYSVTGLSPLPCTQSDPAKPQIVTCAVKVEPLKR